MKPVNIPKIRVNAEFQRLLWLNFSPGLIAGTVIAYLLFFCITNHEITAKYIMSVGSTGAALFALAVCVLIHRSLDRDTAANTFDQLRMSSLSPWQTACARIIAAPANAWIGFFIGWLLLLAPVITKNGNPADSRHSEILPILLALPLHVWSLACLVMVNSLLSGKDSRSWDGSAGQVLLLIIIVNIFTGNLVSDIRNIDFLSGETAGPAISPAAAVFAASLLSAALVSAVLAAVTAAQLHLKPVGSILAVLALLSPLPGVLLYQGFAGTDRIPAAALSTLTYGCLAQMSVFCQHRNARQWRTAWQHLISGRLKAASDLLPLWIILLPAGTAAAALGGFPVITPDYILNILLPAGIVAACFRFSLRINSLTLAMIIWLLWRLLALLIRL